MEDTEQFCNNCKRNISVANFASHSAFCERNIKVCPKCNEPVPVAEGKQHLEEAHVLTPCDLCGEVWEKWMLPKHQETCYKRLVTCEICELAVPFDEYEKHNNFCGSRTEVCLICKKYIMLRDKAKHSKEGCYKGATCKFCKSTFPQNEYDEHLDFCGSRTEKCLICKKYVMMREKENHSQIHLSGIYKENIDKEEKQNLLNEAISITEAKLTGSEKELELNREISDYMKRKGNVSRNVQLEDNFLGGAVAATSDNSKQPSRYYTTCHICRQQVPWIDFNTHVPSCATAYGKCSRCGEEVPRHEMKEHTFKTCPKLLAATQVDESRIIKEISSRYNPGYASRNDLAEEDQSVKSCPYCKQICSSDRILEHVKFCSENYYNCPLCSEKICERDKRKHESLMCRVLYPRAIPVNYECPFCGDEMPEKDKTSHESFSCRKLMEFNQDSPFSDASTLQNVHETKNKNDFEVCGVCNDKIPRSEMFRHEMSCLRDMKTPCIYCEELILAGYEDLHLKSCKKFNKSKTSKANKKEYEYKDDVSQHRTFAEMIKPKIGKCKFCKTALNADILKFHETECIHQQIKCPDCYANILVKDYDGHKCRSTKMKGKRGKEQQRHEVKSQSKPWYNPFSIFSSLTSKTHDQYENERNETYANHSSNKHLKYPTEGNDSLYFGQPFIDDVKIPCEFCNELFPASDIVLHETGCNPEISLPKQDSSKNTREDKPDFSKHTKQSYDSSISSSFFATEKGFLPSTKFERIKKNPGSGTVPGEFLNMHNAKVSSLKRETISSTIQSVWNDPPADVEMEEVESTTYSCDLYEKMPHGVNDYKEEFSKEHEKHSIDSDEEVTNMIAFINENPSLDKKDEAISVNTEYVKTTSDTLTGQNLYPRNDYCEDVYMSIKKNIKLDINQIKDSVPYEVSQGLASFRFGNHQMADLSHSDEVGQANVAEDDHHNHTLKLDTDFHIPKMASGDEVTESSELIHEVSETNANQDNLKMPKLHNFRFCDDKISSYLREERIRDQAKEHSVMPVPNKISEDEGLERASETGASHEELKKLSNFRFCGDKLRSYNIEQKYLYQAEDDLYSKKHAISMNSGLESEASEKPDNSEMKYRKAFEYIVNDAEESSHLDNRTKETSDPRIYSENLFCKDDPGSSKTFENKSMYDQALQSLRFSTRESFISKQLKEQSFLRSKKKDTMEVSPDNEEKVHYAKSNESESQVKKAFTIEPAKYYWNPSHANDAKIFDNNKESSENKLSENLKSPKSNLDFSYEDVEKWEKWRSRKPSDC